VWTTEDRVEDTTLFSGLGYSLAIEVTSPDSVLPRTRLIVPEGVLDEPVTITLCTHLIDPELYDVSDNIAWKGYYLTTIPVTNICW